MKSLFRSRAVRGSIFAVPIVATSLAAAIVATPAGTLLSAAAAPPAPPARIRRPRTADAIRV